MVSLDWKNLIDSDLPEVGEITQKTVELAQKESARFRGSVRISTGRFWTDKDFEQRRNKVLRKPLP